MITISLFSLSNLRYVLYACLMASGILTAGVFYAPDAGGALTLVAAGVVVFLCLFCRASVARQQRIIDDLCDILLAASEGRMDVRVNNREQQGRLARLQNATNQLLDLMEAFTKEAAAAMDRASKGDYYRKILQTGLRGELIGYAGKVNAALATMDEKTKSFSHSAGRIGEDIQSVVFSVSTSAEQLSASSDFLTKNVRNIAQQAHDMRMATEESSEALNGIAAATEQFSGSIREIGNRINSSAQLTELAVMRARSVDDHITKLDDVASRVTRVIELITDVADQTNLLALNATIEAARAGEAGKGFAVVATEVKNLAGQTSNAAEQVIEEIQQMQEMTREAVSSVRDINDKINEIDEGARSVAQTTREQTEVVQAISNRIDHAVRQMKAIADNVAAVANGTDESGQELTKLHGEAQSLLGQAQSLDNDVRQFIGQILSSEERS